MASGSLYPPLYSLSTMGRFHKLQAIRRQSKGTNADKRLSYHLCEGTDINSAGRTTAGLLLAQREVVIHDVEWLRGNFSRGSFSRGLPLEFRDEFFFHSENNIRIDVARVLLE